MQEKIELLKKVYQVIGAAAELSHRSPEDVKLIAVSKTKPVDMILDYRRAGLREFGENYVQEFVDKYEQLKDEGIRWHFIGHLQSNKVKYIIDKVYMIHTVHKIKLAKEIQKQAVKHDIPKVRVLIQVNIGKEEQKSGVMPEDTIQLFHNLKQFDRIEVKGLMSIPPFFSAQELRPYHRELLELYNRIVREEGADPEIFSELSMGMSEDFDVAIEEGATMVRIGSVLFGKRN